MRSKTNLSMDSSIKPAYKLVMSVLETSSKIHKPKTYDEAIDNQI